VSEASAGVRARLWDGPVRLTHWLLVGLIAFCWWSAKDHLDWHLWSGEAVLGLVIFRVWWGFAGGGAARFSSFVKGPRTTLAYLGGLPKRDASLTPGHNPLGALSILAILLLLATQVVSGLFAVDVDGLDSGPLSDKVSFDTGRWWAGIHHQAWTALEVLIVLHLAAIAFYLVWKRTNLIGPMITGRRMLPSDPGLDRAPAWRLLAGVALAGAAAWFVAKGLRF